MDSDRKYRMSSEGLLHRRMALETSIHPEEMNPVHLLQVSGGSRRWRRSVYHVGGRDNLVSLCRAKKSFEIAIAFTGLGLRNRRYRILNVKTKQVVKHEI